MQKKTKGLVESIAFLCIVSCLLFILSIVLHDLTLGIFGVACWIIALLVIRYGTKNE